ncbi:hypothetical protein DPQ33_16905 [Oceanidesulfovibrio indonesiensis]|uniref:ATP synthase subunit b n=1 Tax=Oceanidesulfovibrio indonesiensis TaxID=54767 RepID=A0A7M3MAI9_9BACT|nr:hypothetical protein [Oceanidesulfovibrio indonesiensis]TVM14688.1 hypothetical protein DPQ33_16905 [Oceanidesulfovibrio indonesiensis]
MLIDWFTVAAQAVNFIILMILLKVFLYDKIVQAMKKREQNIQDRLHEARKEREEAEEEKRQYEAEQRELEQKKEELLKNAKNEARERREELLEVARRDAQALRRDLEDAVRQESESLVQTFREEASRLCLELARRSISAMADANIQEQAASAFRRVLAEADEQTVSRLRNASQKEGGKATVFSAAELPGPAESAVTRAVQEMLGEDTDVQHRVDEELVLGLELRCGGRSLGWTVRDYLDSVSGEVRTLLAQEQLGAKAQDSPESKSEEGDSSEESGSQEHAAVQASAEKLQTRGEAGGE